MLSRWQLDRIEKIINRGGIIAYPTESVFGLGCDPTNLPALEKILKIKKRPEAKGLIILVSQIEQAYPFIKPLSQAQLKQIQQKQTRATTWLLAKRSGVPSLLCGEHQKLAVRITRHPVARAICEYTDQALVSTSCNLNGKAEMKTSSEVRNKMGKRVDLIVNGLCGEQKASQIIDLESGKTLRH